MFWRKRNRENFEGQSQAAFDAIVAAYDPATPTSDSSVSLFVARHRSELKAEEYALMTGAARTDYRAMFEVLDYAGAERRGNAIGHRFVLEEMGAGDALVVEMDDTGRVLDIVCE